MLVLIPASLACFDIHVKNSASMSPNRVRRQAGRIARTTDRRGPALPVCVAFSNQPPGIEGSFSNRQLTQRMLPRKICDHVAARVVEYRLQCRYPKFLRCVCFEAEMGRSAASIPRQNLFNFRSQWALVSGVSLSEI
jgi:hypothetical protein